MKNKEKLKKIIKDAIVRAGYLFTDKEYEKLTNTIVKEVLKRTKIEFKND